MTHKQLPVRGPFGGVVSDLTSLQAPLTAFDDVLNFLVRKGKVQSRPQLLPYAANTPNFKYLGKFKDANASLHSFGFADYANGVTPAYMFTAGGVVNPLVMANPIFGVFAFTNPPGVVYTQNQVYFANGGYPLSYLDGSNQVQTAGNTPGSCVFLAINVDHIIQANCTEPAITGKNYPRRVRWSGQNTPLSWDPSADFTAGVNDLLDVPDDISGLMTLGRYTFVMRTNGITAMIPTGQLGAFAFENFTTAPEGVGNIFPYAIAVYDNRGIFIANDDLRLFDGMNMQGIGGPNRKKIYADLASATGTVIGNILPNFTLGFDLLCYLLTIPGPNVTWLYTFDDGQWVRFSSSAGPLQAARTVYTS